jgi:D-alanyl-D-alanine carboxypeptidase (penicillin-binding protein 5/6)
LRILKRGKISGTQKIIRGMPMFKNKLETKPTRRSIAFFLILLASMLLFVFIRPDHSNSDQVFDTGMANMNPAVRSGYNPENMATPSEKTINIYADIVRAGLLYDIFSETVIWEKNMHESYPIASLTKMMVALLVMEDINSGKITWDTMVQVTAESTRTGGFTVSLKEGRVLTIEHLLKAAMISSGNDAAYLLAQFIGGTEKNFVNRMNSRAKQLGMNSTRFSNASGMPAPNRINDNRSSPSDLLILCKEMLKHEKLMHIAGKSEASILQGDEIIQLRNHNRLVAAFDEVDGLKTGYTRNAKFCLAATANKNNRRVISIALGIDSADLRNQFVGNMLSQYYNAHGMGTLELRPGLPIAYAQGNGLPGHLVPAVHQVRKGDTLYSIAKNYGCTIAQLKSWNRLKGHTIIAGQQLKINRPSLIIHVAAAHSTGSSVIYYTVKPGDTLWRISQKYEGISVQKLMQINGIKRASELKAGETIKIILDRRSTPA